MFQAIVPSEPKESSLPAPLIEKARDYMSQSKADNTRRAYRADWKDFCAWGAEHGRATLPASPESVALYLADRADHCKPATLQRRLSAISQAHAAAGHETPTRTAPVRAVWQGIRRTKGTAAQGKAPVLTADLRGLIATLPETLAGNRDRALLLIGFAGAFRRSELVSLDRSDLEFSAAGVTITLRRSKTDQDGAGRKVGIPFGSRSETCPVSALECWLNTAGIADGPLFRPVNRHGQVGTDRLSAQTVALVVKRAADKAGLDPARYAGHSLRAGLATSAAAAGVSERAIMNQTGHRGVQMVRRYIREGSLFRENAAASVGL